MYSTGTSFCELFRTLVVLCRRQILQTTWGMVFVQIGGGKKREKNKYILVVYTIIYVVLRIN